MPITANQLREKEDYQRMILNALRDGNGYVIRPASAFDADYAIDREILFKFLNDTQPDVMEKLHKRYKERTEMTIINVINAELNRKSRGLIDVFRSDHGAEFDSGDKLVLMYRRPARQEDGKLTTLYNANILSVMEEVYHKPGERIDLVLFLNGLAIFTVELKCNNQGQTYNDAIEQYKNTRDPKTRLFNKLSGVFAAFVMDLNEAHFCTELRGKSSFFRPFNIGKPKDDNKPYSVGAGNPYNPNGIDVSYMWESIWTKEKIVLLIERFIFIESKKEKDPETGKQTTVDTLVFPRYHQLRAVEKLTANIRENRTANNYLIEHSAGSGKTYTIAWLTHILASIHDLEDKNVFDTILVITDRIIVDRQLQEAISNIRHKSGQVKVLSDGSRSDDLAVALKGKTKIIASTVHKFLHILEDNVLGSLKDKTFAVLIDEAHSSTEGTLMRAVTTVLAGGKLRDIEKADDDEESDDELTTDDKIKIDRAQSGKQPNVSMIAFTATPKPGTLALFGTLNATGKKTSFDLYCMRQAIEEEYILNVLDNYVTWKTYFNLNKTISDNPEYSSIAAKRKIARFVDLHPTNITQKVAIIIEHFRTSIMKMLDSAAKAMVVTSSREAAVRYALAFEDYIKANKYVGIRALVAFTGKVSADGVVYEERKMNNISEEALRDEFDKPLYQVLIVADKYQTGFDQKKLVAMYVDKKLHGVTAVQTLSRLNRICPPYNKRTFVLDFKNDYDDIRKAFEPFYEDTELFASISPADIRVLEKEIDGYNVLDADEITEFNDLLYLTKRGDKEKNRMWSLLNIAARRVNGKTDIDERSAIKGTMRRFIRLYCFLIQASCFEDAELHKLYNYLLYLVRQIEVKGNDFDIADKITVSDFKQEKSSVHQATEIESKPELKMVAPKPKKAEAEQLKMLSVIIDEINATYGNRFTKDVAMKAAQGIISLLMQNERLKSSAKNNPIEDFKFTYDNGIEDALVIGLDENVDFYTLLLTDREIRERLTSPLMREIYEQLRKS